ncbi:PREDICTED: F-box/kelch-repeat protein At1g67480-like [Tarenaya hassleriana]|uniref:F-box/kelch-repeat protein At1g67480-like n=1 Tax=Tarenaya hassleriana TaxID=28532 RepID=UPI00053C3073|nr:PREDICTED: F-box/kelch-repeat protein At1g67480-like [Tarenaya hassleriana]XP_010556159.1 PREDICTED: F-box/kelch-repeat protein At1g67480-like [Tarenaya hassleriana]
MHCLVSGKKRTSLGFASWLSDDFRDNPLIPGLPDDVAKLCLTLVPRADFPSMGSVSKKWRFFMQSKEFITVRKLAGVLEEWLYVLTMDCEGKESNWEVMDSSGHKRSFLPPMPGPAKSGFGVVVLNGRLLVLAGVSVTDGARVASADVYQYDSCLNNWSKLPELNVARYGFACAEVNGLVYVAGGHGIEGNSLSSAEVYDPQTGKWTVIDSLRRPRWGCFAFGFNGKFYVMGGRSNFTIGNSKLVDIYNPELGSWRESKNGLTMVTAHAEMGEKLFCIQWKNQRKMVVFNPEDESWDEVDIPLSGSSRAGFQFGKLGGKLLLFPSREENSHNTLLYDPNADPAAEWKTSQIKPFGSCVCSVTITV